MLYFPTSLRDVLAFAPCPGLPPSSSVLHRTLTHTTTCAHTTHTVFTAHIHMGTEAGAALAADGGTCSSTGSTRSLPGTRHVWSRVAGAAALGAD